MWPIGEQDLWIAKTYRDIALLSRDGNIFNQNITKSSHWFSRVKLPSDKDKLKSERSRWTRLLFFLKWFLTRRQSYSRTASQVSSTYPLVPDGVVRITKVHVLVRNILFSVRLDLIIQYQEEDRNESFDEMCLFCSQKFVGGREACIEFFRHMNNTHQFNIGHPDNMVR